MASNEEIVRAA